MPEYPKIKSNFKDSPHYENDVLMLLHWAGAGRVSYVRDFLNNYTLDSDLSWRLLEESVRHNHPKIVRVLSEMSFTVPLKSSFPKPIDETVFRTFMAACSKQDLASRQFWVSTVLHVMENPPHAYPQLLEMLCQNGRLVVSLNPSLDVPSPLDTLLELAPERTLAWCKAYRETVHSAWHRVPEWSVLFDQKMLAAEQVQVHSNELQPKVARIRM